MTQRERHAEGLRKLAVARQLVIERDHGLCAKCSAMGTVVHHVFGRYGKLLWDETKMILLCHLCHTEAHDDLGESRIYLMGLLEE